MNKRVKKLWIKALKSGKYKQTIRTLHDQNGYCCLGVLCNIYNREKGYGGVKNGSFLTSGVMKWAGLESDNPLIGTQHAGALNDILKLTFNEIADKIESNL